LMAVLDYDVLAEDKLCALDWLREPVKRAKDAGKWVLVVVHEPVVTTAWFEKPCCATLKPLHDMGVDLVFSGHQHSFERTYPLEVTMPSNRIQPVAAPERALYRAGVYQAGKGVVYVVTGGGGAWLRPFADQQVSSPPEKIAPPYIHRAVARRGIMNHYVRVDLDANRVGVTTMRVCAPGEARWKPNNAGFWPGGSGVLECQGTSLGTSVADHFELRRTLPLPVVADQERDRLPIAFQEVMVKFQPTVGRKQTMSWSAAFDRPVRSAQAMLKGFELGYTDEDRPFWRQEVNIHVQEVQGNVVTGTIEFLLRDRSGNIDDRYDGWANVFVIAVLE
jgi:Calcineurin-like phosphoesterase